MKKLKQGFTLTELIVVIVISGIVLTMLGYFIINFHHLNEQITWSNEQYYEEQLVCKTLKAFFNEASLNGDFVSVSDHQVLNRNLNKSFLFDNEKGAFIYEEQTYLVKTITDLCFLRTEKICTLKIIFNNNEVYQETFYIPNLV